MRSELKRFLEKGEEILFCGDDVLDSRLAEANPVVVAIGYYCMFSGLFWVCIALNYIQGIHNGESIWSALGTSWLSILLVIGIAFAVRAQYPRLKESLKETAVIITNFRVFRAPSAENVAAIKWNGPRPKEVIWFADSVSVTKGPRVSNPLLLFSYVDHDYGKNDGPVTRVKLVSVKQLDDAYAKLPDALRIDELKILKNESGQEFYLRVLNHMETRNTQLGWKAMPIVRIQE